MTYCTITGEIFSPFNPLYSSIFHHLLISSIHPSCFPFCSFNPSSVTIFVKHHFFDQPFYSSIDPSFIIKHSLFLFFYPSSITPSYKIHVYIPFLSLFCCQSPLHIFPLPQSAHLTWPSHQNSFFPPFPTHPFIHHPHHISHDSFLKHPFFPPLPSHPFIHHPYHTWYNSFLKHPFFPPFPSHPFSHHPHHISRWGSSSSSALPVFSLSFHIRF